MTFQDETRPCLECGDHYVWASREQRLAHERDFMPPKRCPRCTEPDVIDCPYCGAVIPLRTSGAVAAVMLATDALLAGGHIDESDAEYGCTACMACTERLAGPNWRTFGEGQMGKWKPYRGEHLIDRELNDEQMDRLNAVTGIEVYGTCAGHPRLSGLDRFAEDDGLSPMFCFSVCSYGGASQDLEATRLASRLRSHDTEATVSESSVFVRSRIVNTGTNQDELHAWWDAVIRRLLALRAPVPLGSDSVGCL